MTASVHHGAGAPCARTPVRRVLDPSSCGPYLFLDDAGAMGFDCGAPEPRLRSDRDRGRGWAMRIRYSGSRPRLSTAFAFILVLAPFAASNAAGADDGQKGWFIVLDYALTQPGSLDQHFATHVDAS